MNKKIIALVTGVVIGGSVLTGTAYANASQLSGYEAYKLAAKNTVALKNFTADAKVAISDNGAKLIDGSTDMKMNKDADAMSQNSILNENGKTISMDNYKQDGKNITKTSGSDEYRVIEGRKEGFKHNKTENTQMTKCIEVIFDTLVGDMKNGVVVSDNSDGTKNVTVDINEKQVTPAVNALVSMALGRTNDKEMNKGKNGIDIALPSLQGDVNIKSVNLTANIDKNDVITDQTAKITVIGKDAQGKEHEIAINANIDLTNINSTTPNKVDLTGKQVKNITPGEREHK